jgi:hypothetical protein
LKHYKEKPSEWEKHYNLYTPHMGLNGEKSLLQGEPADTNVTRRRTPFRLFLLRFFSVLIGLAIGFIIFEAASHIFGVKLRFKPKNLEHPPDPYIGYTCSWVAPAAGSRVFGLAIGDSFSAPIPGVKLAETYPGLLEKAAGRPFVNMSCSGYGTIQETALAYYWIPALKPKWVTIGVFAGNDWLDDYDFQHWRKNHPRIPYEVHHKLANELPSCESFLYKVSALLLGRSASYSLFYNVFLKKAYRDPGRWHRADRRAAETGRQYSFGALRALAGLCRGNGAELLVVIVRGSGDIRTAPLQKELERFLDSIGVKYVDPLTILREEEAAGRPPFLGDGHWNPEVHKGIAALLAAEIFPGRAHPRKP